MVLFYIKMKNLRKTRRNSGLIGQVRVIHKYILKVKLTTHLMQICSTVHVQIFNDSWSSSLQWTLPCPLTVVPGYSSEISQLLSTQCWPNRFKCYPSSLSKQSFYRLTDRSNPFIFDDLALTQIQYFKCLQRDSKENKYNIFTCKINKLKAGA